MAQKSRDGEALHPGVVIKKSVFFLGSVAFLGAGLDGGGIFALKALHANVAGGAAGVRGKGVGTIMTDTAVLAGIEGFHGKLLGMLLGGTNPHFKLAVMAASAIKPHLHMALVIKGHRFYGLIKNDRFRLFHIAAVTDLAGLRPGGIKGGFAIMAGTAVLAGIQ